MKLLLLGGTAFLGRAIATDALRRGHEVTCVARGQSGRVVEGATLVTLDRDREPLSPLAEHRWDATVDLARQPGHVQSAVRDLGAAAGHFIFVSTGNVYADTRTRGLDESGALLPALTDDFYTDIESYGPGKVACEQAALDAYGDDGVLIARAGLIGGPGDRSGRTGYWPWRFAHPAAESGDVLVPAARETPAQIIDVRDLAGWLVDGAERRIAGAFNATGDRSTLGAMLDASREVAGFDGDVVSAANDWLQAHEVAEWAGPRSLPLWLADEDWMGFPDRDNAKARAAGLTPRPVRETLRDVLAFEEERTTPRSAGLTDTEELELHAAYAQDAEHLMRRPPDAT